jgi:hypothetical protein
MLAFALAGGGAHADELRVCADPANPPYSQRDESGFENRIARLVAEDLHMRLSWFWQEQSRGFVRKTMGAGQCDLFVAVPAGFDKVLRTRPYYRSTYVAVTRLGTPPFGGFDPDRLRARRFGVQLIGNDLAASPPGLALAEHGAVENVTGFPVYGETPAGKRMVDAVGRAASTWPWCGGRRLAGSRANPRCRWTWRPWPSRPGCRCPSTTRSRWACARATPRCATAWTRCWRGARPTSRPSSTTMRCHG